MKTLSLKIKTDDLKLPPNEKEKNLVTDTIEAAFTFYINQSKGVPLKEMRQVYKILELIETASDNVNLEDSQYEFLKDVFCNKVKWSGGIKLVVRIAENIENAKEAK